MSLFYIIPKSVGIFFFFILVKCTFKCTIKIHQQYATCDFFIVFVFKKAVANKWLNWTTEIVWGTNSFPPIDKFFPAIHVLSLIWMGALLQNSI